MQSTEDPHGRRLTNGKILPDSFEHFDSFKLFTDGKIREASIQSGMLIDTFHSPVAMWMGFNVRAATLVFWTFIQKETQHAMKTLTNRVDNIILKRWTSVPSMQTQVSTFLIYFV
jgi:hypothetical protein